MILTPEFIAEVESIWDKTQQAVREYARHPRTMSCRGPNFCVTPGCPNAEKAKARKAGAA